MKSPSSCFVWLPFFFFNDTATTEIYTLSLHDALPIPANAVLVYLLIHGKLGLPRLELFGAGLATTIINFGMFLASLWFAYRRPPFRKYQVLGRIWRVDWMLMRQLIVIGAPIWISFLLEYGL